VSGLLAASNRLARLDVCAISDALDQLGMASVVTGIAPQTVRKRISGQLVTVRLGAGAQGSGAPRRHLCTAAIERGRSGDIVVVEQRTGLDAAGWGGILSNAASVKGLAGVIIDGPARDLDEAAGLGFAVYARTATAHTARGRIYETETGGTVRIGDVVVAEGDWAVADSSGIAFIAQADIEVVLAAAERIAEREVMMTKAVLSGQAPSVVMGIDYERLIEAGSGGDKIDRR
jgi:4-hydroxy-4-methyl-2-oxoglutarate aldolase